MSDSFPVHYENANLSGLEGPKGRMATVPIKRVYVHTSTPFTTHHLLASSFNLSFHDMTLSIALVSLAMAPLAHHVAGWHFQTNGIQYLKPDIHDSVAQFARETVDLTWDGAGIRIDEVSFGTLDDDWVLDLLASNNGSSARAFPPDEEFHRISRQQDDGTEAACGTPNCDDRDIYRIQSLQTQQSVITWGCRGVEWGAIPTATAAIAIKVTGYFCGSGDGAFYYQLVWSVGIADAGLAVWLGGDAICQYLVRETLDACEQAGGGKTCTVRNDGQVGQLSVRTTIGPPEERTCGSDEERFEFEWEG
jgi:hypothetical protein